MCLLEDREMEECLHIVGEVDVKLVSDDPTARRDVSVQLVCGSDSGQAAAGLMSLNLSEEVVNYVVPEEEEFVERKKFLTVDGKNFHFRTRTLAEGQKTILVKRAEENAGPAAFGSTGIRIQTPFFPGQIRINTSTGLITILPPSSDVVIPRNVPTRVGQYPAVRKLVPGMNVAFAGRNGKIVCAEKGGAGRLKACKAAVAASETFSVVHANGWTEERFGLRSGANGKYVTYADGPLIANRTEVLTMECFVEKDAGDGKVALMAAHNYSYVGHGEGQELNLVPEMNEWEKFTVLPVVHAWSTHEFFLRWICAAT